MKKIIAVILTISVFASCIFASLVTVSAKKTVDESFTEQIPDWYRRAARSDQLLVYDKKYGYVVNSNGKACFAELSDQGFDYWVSTNDIVIPEKFNGIDVEEIWGCIYKQSGSGTPFDDVYIIDDETGESILLSSPDVYHGTFETWRQLVDLTVPRTVRTIGTLAFACCGALKNVTIYSDELTIYDEAFATCIDSRTGLLSDNLENVTIYARSAVIQDEAFQNYESITFHGYVGSTVEEFASTHGYGFVPLRDINDDGSVNISDVTYIQKDVAKLVELSDNQSIAADVNGDNVINIIDATALQKDLAGLNN